MDELTGRERQAMESILDNEALTANLDDAAAQVLLDWGTAYARQAAQHPPGRGDADARLEEKLQATQRLMRAVNQRFDPAILTQFETDPQARTQADQRLLQQVLEQASIIWESQLAIPTDEQLIEFAQGELARSDTPQTLITTLRRFVEQHEGAPPVTQATAAEAPAHEQTAPQSTAPPTPPPEDATDAQELHRSVPREAWLRSLIGRLRTTLERLKREQNSQNPDR
jgi:hypothetical protein